MEIRETRLEISFGLIKVTEAVCSNRTASEHHRLFITQAVIGGLRFKGQGFADMAAAIGRPLNSVTCAPTFIPARSAGTAGFDKHHHHLPIGQFADGKPIPAQDIL